MNLTEIIATLKFLSSLPEDLRREAVIEIKYRASIMKTFKLSDVLAYTSNPRLLAHIK